MADTKPDNEKGMTFTALVRIHEANCGIDYPTDVEQNFRIAVMKAIAGQLGLKELRDAVITGPGKGLRREKAAA
ncbi:MAG TPA: hypothetical protein VHY22_00450 [Chthoniobacteraceae bacterium]|jgi:hypothetical protein|nr:hypothetical protein [Chthoniobacteraceae bacterium]